MVKVERSEPAPASLAEEKKKKNGSYSKEDVVERLKTDFHNKCYICELKELQDPEVEHLLPHKSGMYPDRKFDWHNLFWSCGHCNGVKNQAKYDGKIIDCCVQDPEKLISFRCNDQNIELECKTEDDEKIETTMQLIYEVFNLRNTGMRVYTSDARFKALQKEMNLLFDNLEEIKKNPESKYTLQKLRVLLRRESAFAAFKRCYVRERVEEYPFLAEYVQ